MIPHLRLIRLSAWIAILGSAIGLAQPSGGGRSGPTPAVAALDLNGDGTIDADELSRASKSLALLDRNGDGRLTREEYRQSRTPAAPASLPSAGPALADRTSGKPSAAPNILVIMADDLGWNGVGFHQDSAPTPNLNRLAREGMEMSRFYTYPVCSPSRAAFLTGVNPRRFGIVDALNPNQAGIPANTQTLPATLRAAGYRTSLIGKWHLGEQNPPLSCGFEHFYGCMGPQIDYFAHTGPRGTADWQRDGKPLNETGYSTDLLADEAVRQLRNRDPNHPIFMQVAFTAPHAPLSAPEALVAKHRDGGGLYAAVIESLDLAIGRILTAVDETGMRDNTLVLFFSDNGAGPRFSSNTPLRQGKDTVYEGGIRVPCVIRWPGHLPAGTRSDHPLAIQDLYPTLLASAGLTLPATAKPDGQNQWPAVITGKPASRTPILIASHDLALVDGDWKLIESETGTRTLYDLKADTGETRDLLANRPEMATRLGKQLDELKRDLPPAPARRSKPGAGGRRQ